MPSNIINPNTGTGDYGKSSIINTKPAFKDTAVFNLLGDLDEACSAIGVARAVILDNEVKDILKQVQTDLIAFSANVAYGFNNKRFGQDKVKELEDLINRYKDCRGTSKDWKIPGESISDAFLHNARSITRRAERTAVHFMRKNNLSFGLDIAWLNRLSDLLYLLAIYIKE